MAKSKRPKYSAKNKRSFWIGYGIALGHDRRKEHGQYGSKGLDLMRTYERQPDVHLEKGYDRYLLDKYNDYLVMTRMESPKKAFKVEREWRREDKKIK